MFLGYIETLFILLVPHFFSNFAPTSAKKLLYKQSKNQRGDPWGEKYFFHNLSLIFLKHVPNDCICRPDSKNMYNMGSKHPIRPVHAPCTLCSACIERAQACRALSYNNMYVFGISTTNATNWNMF